MEWERVGQKECLCFSVCMLCIALYCTSPIYFTSSPCVFPFHEAVQVLDLFRDQFIEEMDANAVVLELLHNNIIDRGDQRTIAANTNPTQQNQFLHLILKEKCTEEAFQTVCDIITAVKGNPKMKALGESMKRRLEIGG